LGSEINKLKGADFIRWLDKLPSNATAVEMTSQGFRFDGFHSFNWS
jgi:hypothetical protein